MTGERAGWETELALLRQDLRETQAKLRLCEASRRELIEALKSAIQKAEGRQS